MRRVERIDRIQCGLRDALDLERTRELPDLGTIIRENTEFCRRSKKIIRAIVDRIHNARCFNDSCRCTYGGQVRINLRKLRNDDHSRLQNLLILIERRLCSKRREVELIHLKRKLTWRKLRARLNINRAADRDTLGGISLGLDSLGENLAYIESLTKRTAHKSRTAARSTATTHSTAATRIERHVIPGDKIKFVRSLPRLCLSV